MSSKTSEAASAKPKKSGGFGGFFRRIKDKSAAAKGASASASASASGSKVSNSYYKYNPNKPKPAKKETVASKKPAAKTATTKKAPVPTKEASVSTPKVSNTQNANAKAASTASSESSNKAPKASWLCQTKMFRNMCDTAFELIDVDGSGEVDEKELYSGLLLIHLKLGTMAGPAACKPLSRERCHDVFVKFDKDKSGHLDKKEFDDVMVLLFGNVLFRVMLQYSMTLLIVPFVAKIILDGIYWCLGAFGVFISNLDERYAVFNMLELTIEGVRDTIVGAYASYTPGVIQRLGSKVASLLDAVPDSVWNSIPLTLTSAVLGIVVVPWSLMKMDDAFQYLADKRAKAKPEH